MISVISEITKLFILTTFVSVECSTKLIDTKEFSRNMICDSAGQTFRISGGYDGCSGVVTIDIVLL